MAGNKICCFFYLDIIFLPPFDSALVFSLLSFFFCSYFTGTSMSFLTVFRCKLLMISSEAKERRPKSNFSNSGRKTHTDKRQTLWAERKKERVREKTNHGKGVFSLLLLYFGMDIEIFAIFYFDIKLNEMF